MADTASEPSNAPDQEAEPKFSKEMLELARRIYDENRLYVEIGPGMINQVHRNGLLTKQTMDGSKYIRAKGSKNYYRDSRSITPDGALIIHRDDEDPYPGACSTFIHPPYGFITEYRGEKDQPYSAEITLAELSAGTESCGFCSILYNGIKSKREFWIHSWAKYKWFDTNSAETIEQQSSEKPWVKEYWDEIGNNKSIDETCIFLYIKFTKAPRSVDIHMMVPPSPSLKSDQRRTLIDLEFYTEPGFESPWAAFGTASHISSEVFSETCLSRISQWIRECKDEHPLCNSGSSRDIPKRLLRIGWSENNANTTEAKKRWLRRVLQKVKALKHPERLKRLRRKTASNPTEAASTDDIPFVQLHITEPGLSYKYIALSHVWSLSKPLRTTLANFSDHKKTILWSSLSFAFRDAVLMALSLEVDYLWIDSLCIIQDSQSDWDAESRRMGQIYKNALIVFAALGPELGLEKAPLQDIREDNPDRQDDSPVFVREKMDHSPWFSSPIAAASYHSRGWCMQERFLASRVLYFGGYCEELFFECNTHFRCECGRVGEEAEAPLTTDDGLRSKSTLKFSLARSLDDIKRSESSASHPMSDLVWKTYVTAIEDYSARKLTFPSDTFPAISSLMATLAPQLGQYFAGLWEHNLILSLQWQALSTLDSTRHHHEKGFVAPSFSWASRSGAVIWYMDCDSLPSLEKHKFATVVEIKCVIGGKDQFGIVQSGFIRLRGPIVEMRIHSKTMLVPDGRIEMRSLATVDNEEDKGSYVTLDARQDIEEVKEGLKVVCLDIMRDIGGTHGSFVSALVLLPIAGGNKFRRIGFSTMSEIDFKKAIVKEVTIV